MSLTPSFCFQQKIFQQCCLLIVWFLRFKSIIFFFKSLQRTYVHRKKLDAFRGHMPFLRMPLDFSSVALKSPFPWTPVMWHSSVAIVIPFVTSFAFIWVYINCRIGWEKYSTKATFFLNCHYLVKTPPDTCMYANL